MNVLELNEIGRAAILNTMVLTGWLISCGVTYALFHATLKENRQYIKDLLESIKAMNDG